VKDTFRLCVLLTVLLPLAAASPTQPEPTADTVMASARAYLDKYRTDLGFVIADEDTTQRIIRQVPDQPDQPRARRVKSEVHFRFIAEGLIWMAIRDVREVDGTGIKAASDFTAAIQAQDAVRVAKAYKAMNSKYNLGRTTRNFNEPTLALGVLDPSRAAHFDFVRKSKRSVDGQTLVVIGFKEQPSVASFVYDLDLRPAPVEGELTIDAATGRVQFTVLRMRLGAVKAELSTVYRHDARLNIWVPTTFRESYEDGVDRPGSASLNQTFQYESIFVESKYTNFRRFAATARIK
jgi:hypothetical protein